MFNHSFLSWSYGFLQNVIAKVISINNVYKSLTYALAQDWEELTYFNVGRLIRLLLFFDPVDMEEPGSYWYTNVTCTQVTCTAATGLLQSLGGDWQFNFDQLTPQIVYDSDGE